MSATPSSPRRQDATDLVARAARAARCAQRTVAGARREVKDTGLHAMADRLGEAATGVLAANTADLERARTAGMRAGLIDRLSLTPERIAAIAGSLREIAALPDPVGEVVDGRTLPNGLRVRRVRVPVGVVGMIYEARPNVTVDVAALTLKSGNAVVLRGGSAAERTNAAIVGVLRDALASAGLPADLVATVDAAGRPGAEALMRARGLIDVLVPRGGAGLIRAVVEQSAVPVIETGSGNCHIYADARADLGAAVPIIVNAKTQRPSTCNTVETLLVHRNIADTFLPALSKQMAESGVTLHAAPSALPALQNGPAKVEPVKAEQYDDEYLSLDLNVKVVADMDEAIAHIREHGTQHSDAILTRTLRNANRFINEVDSSAVYVNASTRFTDGGQFGLGAEVAVSTQKLHARGPMGLTEMTTTKYLLLGEGQTRA